MTVHGDLFVVIGCDALQVSQDLRLMANSAPDHHLYYTLSATAKMLTSSYHCSDAPMIGSVMSLYGSACAIKELVADETEGNIYHRTIRLVIHDCEAFSDQDDAYDVLTELRLEGHHLLIGGRENTLLIEKLALDAQGINPRNVLVHRPSKMMR